MRARKAVALARSCKSLAPAIEVRQVHDRWCGWKALAAHKKQFHWHESNSSSCPRHPHDPHPLLPLLEPEPGAGAGAQARVRGLSGGGLLVVERSGAPRS